MTDRAVIILGHGSRSPEATQQFLIVADAIRPRVPDAAVYPAFMELAEPLLADAITSAVEEGARRIVVLPCFLFMGNHIKLDIPRHIARVAEKYPDVEFEMREPIGPDLRVADILLERLGFASAEVWGQHTPVEIEAESMRVIDAGLAGFPAEGERAVAKRLIHASGDLSLQSAIEFSPGAIAAGIAALRGGAPVVTDVRMVATGVDATRLAARGGTVRCLIDDAEVAEEAAATGRTRAATAMRRLARELDGAVVAIGNAPSALREVIAMVTEGVARPALVVGVPVGFVDAAESKEALRESGLEYVVVRGARGGSPLAAAGVNALLRLAEGGV